ncbi:hypothetical protein ACFSM5_04935 [Lacibacterium aquatile]|uniref:Outer membrane lipoprotein-sorting protein n=1 Tax=Lacibacterium aquatile TaxID=1168082 RepID=A0ABW5DM58_9PROT
MIRVLPLLLFLALPALAQSPEEASHIRASADAYLKGRYPDLWRAEVGWDVKPGAGETWSATYRAAPQESGKARLSAELLLSKGRYEVLREDISVLRADWDILSMAKPVPADLLKLAQEAAGEQPGYDAALPWVVWDSADWIRWNRRYRLYAVRYFGVEPGHWLVGQTREDGTFGIGAQVMIAKADRRVARVFFEK